MCCKLRPQEVGRPHGSQSSSGEKSSNRKCGVWLCGLGRVVTAASELEHLGTGCVTAGAWTGSGNKASRAQVPGAVCLQNREGCLQWLGWVPSSEMWTISMASGASEKPPPARRDWRCEGTENPANPSFPNTVGRTLGEADVWYRLAARPSLASEPCPLMGHGPAGCPTSLRRASRAPAASR